MASGTAQFPRFIVFVKDDTKSIKRIRPMKRAMQELLDEDQMNGRMMTCAQSGATYTEATAFCKKAFGIDNPKILSSSNIEIRAGTVLTDQLYFCQDASKGPSSRTYFKPHKLVCPDERLLMGNFTLMTRNAEEFCMSETLKRSSPSTEAPS